MKLLGALIASAAAFGGMVGTNGAGRPPAYLFVEDYDKKGLQIPFFRGTSVINPDVKTRR